MKRLTFVEQPYTANRSLNCARCPMLTKCNCASDCVDSAVNRLAAIEDILGDDYDLSRLRELVQADREGRCEVHVKQNSVITSSINPLEKENEPKETVDIVQNYLHEFYKALSIYKANRNSKPAMVCLSEDMATELLKYFGLNFSVVCNLKGRLAGMPFSTFSGPSARGFYLSEETEYESKNYKEE